MFPAGHIVYFDPFYFKNGNTAKPKYFVVLKTDGNKSLIASLPTRTDAIPANESILNGCIELPGINLNCFVISSDQIITECGKRFTFTTYLYGHQIDDYDIEKMKEIYPNEGSDYVVFGKMKSELFKNLIDCFKTSLSVKRKYKKLL
ncbi:MAG: hypothetical protein L6264_00020 [Weeksellaceae bacterium]|nr:hypothetical protein [Bacteroidota bacterium]MCG2779307.1 hypothetical protein [Weeksellaceae bacterium]